MTFLLCTTIKNATSCIVLVLFSISLLDFQTLGVIFLKFKCIIIESIYYFLKWTTVETARTLLQHTRNRKLAELQGSDKFHI
jgi:hypothetical protein